MTIATVCMSINIVFECLRNKTGTFTGGAAAGVGIVLRNTELGGIEGLRKG